MKKFVFILLFSFNILLAEATTPDHGEDSIYLADGSLLKGKLVEVTTRDFIVEDKKGEKKNISRPKVLLIVYADGTIVSLGKSYDQTEATQEHSMGTYDTPAKDNPVVLTKNSEALRKVTWGIAVIPSGGYAYNLDLNNYAKDLTDYLVVGLNSVLGSGFRATEKQKSILTYGGEIGPRLLVGNYYYGISGGYYSFQNDEYWIDANGYNPASVKLSLFVVPITLEFGYDFLRSGTHRLWIVGGTGLYYAEAKLEITGLNPESYSGLGLGIHSRLEYQYFLSDHFSLSIGLALRYAQVQKLEKGNIALINGNTGKVAAAGSTGATLYVGAGLWF